MLTEQWKSEHHIVSLQLSFLQNVLLFYTINLFNLIAKFEDDIKYDHHNDAITTTICSLFHPEWSVTYPKYWFHNAMKNFT